MCSKRCYEWKRWWCLNLTCRLRRSKYPNRVSGAQWKRISIVFRIKSRPQFSGSLDEHCAFSIFFFFYVVHKILSAFIVFKLREAKISRRTVWTWEYKYMCIYNIYNLYACLCTKWTLTWERSNVFLCEIYLSYPKGAHSFLLKKSHKQIDTHKQLNVR